MSKKCGNCGNLVRDDASVFCNKCGSQLPEQEFLTCKRCGTTHSDLKSQFCSKCGTPLDIPTPSVLSSHPGQGITCPGCGFVNPDESSSYCKKCGNYLGYEPGVSTQKGRSKDAAIRIKPDPVNIARQKNPNGFEAGGKPSHLQRNRIQQKNQSGSYRKIAAVALAIILVIIVLGVATMYIGGMGPANSVNSSGLGQANSANQGTASITPTNSATGSIKLDTPTPGSSINGVAITTTAMVPFTTVTTVSPEIVPTPKSLVYNNTTPPWPTEVKYNITNPWPTEVEYNITNPWPTEVGYNITNPWPMDVKYNATNPW